MRIAQLAPLWKTIPPKKYAGSELVVSDLEQSLSEMGHKVTVFACGGSKTRGRLVKVIPKTMYELAGGFSWSGIMPYEFLEYSELFKRISEFDVIHNHLGFHFLAFSPLIKQPIVSTMHSSAEPDFPYLAKAFKKNAFVSISNAQRKVTPYLNWVKTIYHGINLDDYPVLKNPKRDYLLFIGSLTPQKGADLAVEAARKLKQKLIIAGEVRDKEFVRNKILRYVDGRQIKFVGEVGLKQKSALYRNARATLFPIRWSEAFGLVLVESLASGTPVIALNQGSVPEIITHNKTGFIAPNFSKFLSYIPKIGQLDRNDCRMAAEKRFDRKIMAENYSKLFEQLVSRNK